MRVTFATMLLVFMEGLASAEPVTIDTAVAFQQIDGFGTTERLMDDPHVTETFDPSTARGAVVIPPDEQARILDALYVELGLTRVRYNPRDPSNGVGIEGVNDNSDPNDTDLAAFDFAWKKNDGHIEYVKAVRPRGVTTWFASPLTLETWMTESNPEEYAEWAMAILRRWRDQGAEMPYWSIVNEPATGFSGSWSGTWVRDATKLLGGRLRAEGFATKIVVPDDLNPQEAATRLQQILADPDARQYVGAVAYHLYGGWDYRDEVKLLADQWELPIWMTEYSEGDWLAWAVIMHELLADSGASAVDYMWGYFGQWEGSGPHLITIRYEGNTYSGFEMNKQYYVMGQFSRFVRPGFRRVAATSGAHDLRVSAYSDGTTLTVVALNVGSTDVPIEVEVAGPLAIDAVLPTRTSATEDGTMLEAIAFTGSGFSATLPPRSITTFVSDRPGVLPPDAGSGGSGDAGVGAGNGDATRDGAGCSCALARKGVSSSGAVTLWLALAFLLARSPWARMR